MKKWIPFVKSAPRVSVVRLNGAIMTRQGGLNDQSIASAIERAFRRGKPDAVALSINSPGGSPVQSSLIAARIRRLAAEKEIPVYAFVEDVAASGGYWLACAADKIFVDHSSIVGSIGVISAGFGFDKLIEKHGVERRVYTAGKSKSQMDPFKPENAADVKRIKSLQVEIHDAFVAHVRASREGRLSTETELFDGSFWTGTTGVSLGLADGIGHLVPMMKDIYGDKVQLSVYGPKKPLLSRFGAQLSSALTSSVEEHVLWARFGL
ncbi:MULTISPECIES: S49 family peptidase [Pacificibacter]|uniref:S49 family peptidase n=1 Tax=Pacificibacter TaxID=1042323 RepID=UPI001C07FD27|nr:MULTISPECIES: S49 family peptidase [Pacificibacter]MBU2934717.1 S49 family peptidase [Pacificibacter marinus]MDO6616841.1 S49 family peptidase [Pacificibacter sp. 1_MG-2023]